MHVIAAGNQINASSSSGQDRDTFIFGEPAVSSGEAGAEACQHQYQTFLDMGVCPQLAVALKKTHKTIPTLIQKASFDSLVAKKDVVICAETGSGKTLAYLLPVLQQYYTANEARAGGGLKYPSTVVMVPNKDLMVQVQAMAEEMLMHANTVRTTAGGESCVQVSCGGMERVDGHWPYRGVPGEPLTHAPDILICTPAFLGEWLTD